MMVLPRARWLMVITVGIDDSDQALVVNMGARSLVSHSSSRRHKGILLRDLARLANSAAHADSAGDLVSYLLKACAAEEGALLLASRPPGTAAMQVVEGNERWDAPERVLALVGMDEAALLALLRGGPAGAPRADAPTLAWVLPLHGTRGWPLLAADSTATGAMRCAVVVLRWASLPDAGQRLVQARQLLLEVADGVLAVIYAMLSSERVGHLEAVVAAQATLLRETDAARSDWQQALDAISDPISVVTSDYRVVRANAAYWAKFGHGADAHGIHRCFAHVSGEPGQDQPCADCPLPSTLATGRAGFVQRERLVPAEQHGSLETRIYQTWTYPARNAAGVVDHVVEILRDVTEQEQLRDALSQADALKAADRLKAELLGTVSHELRNPLAAIKGYAATLMRHERRLPREERQEFLRAIQEASDRLEEIIDRLLEMSRLETGTTTMHLAPVNVERIIREALSTRQDRLHSRTADGTGFTVALADGAGAPAASVPFIAGDSRLLRVVLDNLLDNAVKYSPPAGDIAITVAPTTRKRINQVSQPAYDVAGSSPSDGDQTTDDQETLLEICVRDQGMGIPSAHLGRIFDRFHRVDTRLTREVDGLGLGLAICKRIVEMHSGVIWAESQPGQGSAFHVALPVTRA